ncbi:hypothetical protein C8R44DRAFT_773304 [Mycena epipterygia]|nr:hypothetical protein C8R44DRAFT_773304 [Mycena epipterygia]
MSSHLLTLSPELYLSIISYLSLSDKRRLRLVCQIFNNLLILEVPLKELRAATKKRTIFLVEDAHKGELGFEPFVVKDVRKVHKDSDESTSAETNTTHGAQPSFQTQHILIDIYYPKFMRNDDEDDYNEEEENEWEIDIHMQQLSLNSRKKLSSESNRLVKSVDYELLRGKLFEASAALLRSRFVCPECGNSRSVCPGCGGFSGRFPDLFTGCGWPMPCPV